MGEVQGARVRLWRGQEEPGQDDRPGRQAAVQDQDLQGTDRGGRGDRRPQPGQVQEGAAGAGGDRGESQARRPHLNQLPVCTMKCQLKLEENLTLLLQQPPPQWNYKSSYNCSYPGPKFP